MNSNKLIIWVYYLFPRFKALLKSSRNSQVMMDSILNDPTLLPCQIIMAKINPFKIQMSWKEKSKKDKENLPHIIWKERLIFNKNPITYKMKIPLMKIILLNRKGHNFNIMQMVQTKVQKPLYPWSVCF